MANRIATMQDLDAFYGYPVDIASPKEVTRHHGVIIEADFNVLSGEVNGFRASVQNVFPPYQMEYLKITPAETRQFAGSLAVAALSN